MNLTSPLYPKRYPIHSRCEWFVTAAEGGTTTIYFIHFDTKRNQHYFNVGSGSNPGSADTSVFRHSGQHMPRTVSVDGTIMWITFTSDHEKSLTGFVVQLEWSDLNGTYENVTYIVQRILCFFFQMFCLGREVECVYKNEHVHYALWWTWSTKGQAIGKLLPIIIITCFGL